MATPIYIQTDADLGRARVRSRAQRQYDDLPALVEGDIRDFELYLIDQDGAYEAFSGAAYAVPQVRLGVLGGGAIVTAVTFTAITNGWSFALPVTPATNLFASATALTGDAWLQFGVTVTAGRTIYAQLPVEIRREVTDGAITGTYDPVAFGSVVNMSVVTGLIAALALKIDIASKGIADGVASLGSDGLVPAEQLPEPDSSGHIIKDNGTSETARTNLNFIGFTVADNAGTDSTDVTAPGAGGAGDMTKDVYDSDDDGKVDAAVTADIVALAGVTGLIALLANKLETSTRGTANGVASLGSDGLVPAGQLPTEIGNVIGPTIGVQTITTTYVSNGDTNGIVAYIGSNGLRSEFLNPHTSGLVTVMRSSDGNGTASMLVNRTADNSTSTTTAGSWITIDFNTFAPIVLNKYSLQNRTGTSTSAIRNWKLQGSNDSAGNSIAQLNAATWIDIDVRVNDTTMAATVGVWGTYTIAPTPSSYRWFRILHTGLNSGGLDTLGVSEIEFYGTLQYNVVAPPVNSLVAFSSSDGVNVKSVGSLIVPTIDGVTIPSTKASTLTTNGALVVSGGVGIAGAVNIAGIVKLTASVNSNGTSDGTLVITGGLGVSAQAYVGSFAVPGTGTVITKVNSVTGALNFGSIDGDGAYADLTLSVSNATLSGVDSVMLGLPNPPTAGIVYMGWVSANGVVTIRATNVTSSPIDPGIGTFRATIIGFA